MFSLRRAFVTERYRISDPEVDGGFPPAGAMNADFDLMGKSAFGDLAIHSGAGQPGAGQYGFQADDSFKVRHGICFHSLTVVGTPLEEQLANKMSVASAFFGLLTPAYLGIQ